MSDSPTRRMSKALKRELVPSLERLGFGGKFPRYRRETPSAIEFLAIWYDNAATAFFNMYRSPPGFASRQTAQAAASRRTGFISARLEKTRRAMKHWHGGSRHCFRRSKPGFIRESWVPTFIAMAPNLHSIRQLRAGAAVIQTHSRQRPLGFRIRLRRKIIGD